MILAEQTEVKYIPKVGGNLKAKKEDQVVVTLTLPTALERQKWNTIRYASDSKDKIVSEINRDSKSVILSCVSKIDNLRIEEKNGGQKEIATAEELLALRHGFAATLVDELTTLLLFADTIPSADEKN